LSQLRSEPDPVQNGDKNRAFDDELEAATPEQLRERHGKCRAAPESARMAAARQCACRRHGRRHVGPGDGATAIRTSETTGRSSPPLATNTSTLPPSARMTRWRMRPPAQGSAAPRSEPTLLTMTLRADRPGYPAAHLRPPAAARSQRVKRGIAQPRTPWTLNAMIPPTYTSAPTPI